LAAHDADHATLNKSMLRVVVRPTAYLEQGRQISAGEGGPAAVPIAGEFWMISAADRQTTIALLSSRALEPLQLTTKDAFTIGKENMRRAMTRIIEEALKRDRHGIGLLTGDPYKSSLFAFPELWAPLAKAAGGNLLVSVPASDVVLFCDGRRAGASEAMIAAAQKVMATADRPFSSSLFRWSADGWTALPAPVEHGDNRSDHAALLRAGSRPWTGAAGTM
jgi:hypothetical protein